MRVTDNRKRKKRRRGVFKKLAIKAREHVIILSFLSIGTAILGIFIANFFSHNNNKIEKTFYVENEHIKNQNEIDDKDANRVMRLARKFLENRVDEIFKSSKK